MLRASVKDPEPFEGWRDPRPQYEYQAPENEREGLSPPAPGVRPGAQQGSVSRASAPKLLSVPVRRRPSPGYKCGSIRRENRLHRTRSRRSNWIRFRRAFRRGGPACSTPSSVGCSLGASGRRASRSRRTPRVSRRPPRRAVALTPGSHGLSYLPCVSDLTLAYGSNISRVHGHDRQSPAC